MTLSFATSSPSRGRSIASWTIRVLLTAVFLAAGGAKLASLPMMVDIFGQIGQGQGFRLVTGLVEVAGALVLLVPGMTVLAALWLAATMCCAVLAHLLVLPGSALPAIVLLVLCLALAWLHRADIPTLRTRLA